MVSESELELDTEYEMLTRILNDEQVIFDHVETTVDIFNVLEKKVRDGQGLEARYFSLLVDLNHNIKESFLRCEQDSYAALFSKFSLAFQSLLNAWQNSSSISVDTLHLEILITLTNKSCEDLVLLKKAKAKANSRTQDKSSIILYHGVCFKSLNDYCSQLSSNSKIKNIEPNLLAFTANKLIDTITEVDDFQDLKSALVVFKNLLMLKKSEEQFLKSLKFYYLINYLSKKVLQILDSHLSIFNSENNTIHLYEKDTIDLNPLNSILRVISTLLKLFGINEANPLWKWTLNVKHSEFVLRILKVNGALFGKMSTICPTGVPLNIIKSLETILETIFIHLKDVAIQIRLLGFLIQLSHSELNVKEVENVQIGKLLALKIVVSSLSQFSTKVLPLFFQTFGPNQPHCICVLKEFFEIVNNLPHSLWIYPGLNGFSDCKDDLIMNHQFSLHNYSVQIIFSCASVLSPTSFTIWETIVMEEVFKSNHFVFLIISEAWCKVWMFLPDNVKNQQLEGFCSLFVSTPADDLLRFRIKTLVDCLLNLDLHSIKTRLNSKLVQSHREFETDPMSFFLLWGSITLNTSLVSDFEVMSALKLTSSKLESLILHPSLMLPLLRFFINVFQSFPYCKFEQPVMDKVIGFCLEILKDSCSSDEKPNDNPELINVCCSLFAAIPLKFIQFYAINILSTLFHHLKCSKSKLIHILILSVTFRCSNVKVDDNLQGQFIHYIRSIMRIFFEADDWAVHYGAVWHLYNIMRSDSYPEALIASLSIDIQRVLAEDFQMKKDVSNRIFFSPELFGVRNKLLVFFDDWLALHPPSSFSIPKLSENESLEEPLKLENIISALQKAIKNPYFLDPGNKKALRQLGSHLLELE